MSQLIVVKEPGKAPEERIVEKVEVGVMREIVGGSFQLIFLDTASGELDLFLNEEGKLEGMEPNIVLLRPKTNVPYDIVVGTIFVCKSDREGYSIGLTEEEAEDAIRALINISIS